MSNARGNKLQWQNKWYVKKQLLWNKCYLWAALWDNIQKWDHVINVDSSANDGTDGEMRKTESNGIIYLLN